MSTKSGGGQQAVQYGDPNMNHYDRQTWGGIGGAQNMLLSSGDLAQLKRDTGLDPNAPPGKYASGFDYQSTSNPEFAAMATRRALAPQEKALPNAGEQEVLDRLGGFDKRPTLSSLEAMGIGTQMDAANPDAQIAAARDYLQRISGPAVTNAATVATGGSRSGAATEALANEGTKMTLPILERSQDAQQRLADMERVLGGETYGREQMNLENALQARGVRRRAELGEENKAREFYLGSMGRGIVPTGAGMMNGTSWSRPSDFETAKQSVQMVGQLVGSVAGAFMGCWMAEMIFGVEDPRFWTWWAWINGSRLGRLIRPAYVFVGKIVKGGRIG